MRSITKIAIAAATLCLLSACGQSRDTKEDLAKLKNLSPKAAYSMGKDFEPKGGDFSGVDRYPTCANRLAEYKLNPTDELVKMDYSGKYKSDCESIFNNVQIALDKKGIHVSLATVEKPKIAQMLVDKHDDFTNKKVMKMMEAKNNNSNPL